MDSPVFHSAADPRIVRQGTPFSRAVPSHQPRCQRSLLPMYDDSDRSEKQAKMAILPQAKLVGPCIVYSFESWLSMFDSVDQTQTSSD